MDISTVILVLQITNIVLTVVSITVTTISVNNDCNKIKQWSSRRQQESQGS
jgi:hypothetical protein